MRRALIYSTRGRHSAFYDPATTKVRSVVRSVGVPMMLDRRAGALTVPIAHADLVDTALWNSGFVVEVVLGLGAA